MCYICTISKAKFTCFFNKIWKSNLCSKDQPLSMRRLKIQNLDKKPSERVI
jgi:hypothetical protein